MSKQGSTELAQTEVVVTVHHKPACCIELEIKATPSLVAEARRTAIKKVNKEIILPGFRKGKAPEEMVVKKHPHAVDKEWRQSIADHAFRAARLQPGVPPFHPQSSISYDLKSHSLENGAELTFTFETEPQVPSVDPKLFVATPIHREEVTDKKVDEAVHQMQFYFANWHPVTERGIQEGDYITIDLDTIDTEEPQSVLQNVRFQVSLDRMAKWMRELVIGAKVGDMFEGISEPDEQATEEEKKTLGPKKVRLFIHRVDQVTLPTMEEFIQKMGEKDETTLRENVRLSLLQNVEDKAHTELRKQVNTFLTQSYVFEIPLSLIESEKRHRMEQSQKEPQFEQAFAKMSDEEKKKFQESVYNEAAEAVRLFYLTRKIVQDAKIPVTHAQVQEEAIRRAREMGESVNPDQIPREFFALALSRIILMKAQDYILSHSATERTSPAQTGGENGDLKELDPRQ